MRVLIIDGTYRDGGLTRELKSIFEYGCREGGATIDEIVLKKHNISYCRGCYECYSEPRPGECVIKDDMRELIPRVIESDAFVVVSPVYFYSLSARFKQFLERLLPITEPRLVLNEEDGLLYNRVRDSRKGTKKAVLITALAFRDLRGVKELSGTFDKIARALGAEPVGRLIRPESHFIDFEASKPKTVLKIRSAFQEAGKAFATDGSIPRELELQASQPLTTSTEAFQRHSATFWDIIAETGVKAGDREATKAVAAEDLRILMPELAEFLDPSAAKGLDVKIQFELFGSKAQEWNLVISGGKCIASMGKVENPDLTIKANFQTVVDMIMQRLDIRQSIFRKEIELEGDRSLFARFGRLFPPSFA